MSRRMRSVQPLIRKITWRPSRAFVAKASLVLGMALVGGVAFGLGRWMGLGSASAQQPYPSLPPIAPSITNANLYDPDYTGRVVAYVKGNIPISRVELAEYLIARFGSERLEFLVNRRIVDMACQAKGIVVTDQEVEHQFRKDLEGFGPYMTAKLFQEQILSRYKKTIFEWKEDVIRPKLGMTKLVLLEGVHVLNEDLIKGYEIRYGPKVQCRMIAYSDKIKATQGWEKIRLNPNMEAGFLEQASNQHFTQLQSTKGEIPPIHRHFGDPRIEKEAFSLKPGEISQVIGMPDNTALIIMCEKHLPADATKRFDTEKLNLHKEIYEMKLAQRVQDKVVELRKDASPRFLLARQPNFESIRQDAAEEINGAVPDFRGAEKK